MTRQRLERFIAEYGIVDASILLHRQPITLERWRNGQDDIPSAEAEWLAGGVLLARSACQAPKLPKLPSRKSKTGRYLRRQIVSNPRFWENVRFAREPCSFRRCNTRRFNPCRRGRSLRSVFQEYYRPTDAEFEALWANGIIAFDASVLLNLYNYSRPTAGTFLTVMETLEQPLWLPHHAALEYHRNRISTIVKSAKEYEEANTLPALITKIKSRRQGPFLSAALVERLEQLSIDLSSELDAEYHRIKALKSNDPIRDQLTELFEGKLGTAFTQAALDAIYADGKKRYADKIPPGFMDEKDKQGNDIYGDLVIWKELIAKAKADDKPVIFVTDDNKDDWWFRFDGGTIGPRVELLREFRAETSQAVYLYNSETFLQYADKLIAGTVDASAIEEIREVRERDRLLTFEKGYEELEPTFRTSPAEYPEFPSSCGISRCRPWASPAGGESCVAGGSVPW